MQFFLLLFSSYILALNLTSCAESEQKSENAMLYQEYLVKEAELPVLPNWSEMNTGSNHGDKTPTQYETWWEAKEAQLGIDIPNIEQIQSFVCKSTREFVVDYKKANFLYSPVDLWFCLYTLSDLVEGNSKVQIQQVIGQQPEDNQDAQLDAVFRSLYWEDDDTVCIPAISLWMNRGTSMSKELIDQLSSSAHTSLFQGDMGEESFDNAFQNWINDQTRGMLDSTVSDLKFSSEAGFSVCSTLYMKSTWSLPFDKEETTSDVFYTEGGEVTTDFMHSRNGGIVFHKKGFAAFTLDFSCGGSVTFILPDPNVNLEDILNGDDVFNLLFSGKVWEDSQYGIVNFSVPKIDTMTGMSMKSSVEKMGIVDIFDTQKAQFISELSSDSSLVVSDFTQYTRLILNEDGVESASITITDEGGLIIQPENEIDFILNRPFLFAVMSEKNIPLFIGTYYTPE